MALISSKEIPADPWGDPYVYRSLARNGGYEVISYGADGKEGGADVPSSSTNAPLKTGNFPKELEKFEGAASYAEWVFEYAPTPVPGGIAGARPSTVRPNAIPPSLVPSGVITPGMPAAPAAPPVP